MQLRRKFLFIFLILSVILIPQMASGSEPTTNNSDVFQSGTLEQAINQAIADYNSRYNMNFKEMGHDIDATSMSGVVYLAPADAAGIFSPGKVDVAVVLSTGQNTWDITLPGEAGYTVAFDSLPSPAKNQVDPTPYERAISPQLSSYFMSTDYEFPWTDNWWATVTRSFNAHGAGKIDFDIDDPNTAIVAAKAGTIIYVNDSHSLNTYGTGAWWYWNTVVIQHGPNEYTTYAHVAKNSVPSSIKSQCSTNYGSQNCSVPVTAGQVIAIQGNTGNSTGPHVHMAGGTTFAISPYADTLDEDNDSNTSETVYTGYGWNLANFGFKGYSISQVAAWPAGTRLQAQHDSVSLQPNVNLALNGTFNSGTDNWYKWGEAAWAVYSGVLAFKREANSPTGAAILQDLYVGTVPSGSTLEFAAYFGNSSSVNKSVTLHLRSTNSWDGYIRCGFSIPPNTPLRRYVMVGETGATWSGIKIEINPEPADGIPDILMDNVTLKYYPTLDVTSTKCIQPSTKKSWDFTGTNGPQGWTLINSMINPTQNSDGMWYRVSATDPFMYGPEMLNVAASSNRYVIITMRSRADSCGTLYYMRSGDSAYSESRSKWFTVNNDGVTHTYIFDMSSDSSWTGNIRQIRIDLACNYNSSADNGILLISVQLTNTLLTMAMNVTAACNGPDLQVNITQGDGPFNITASAGVSMPVNGINTGTTSINGPEKWDDVTVSETSGDHQSVNLGQFKCRSNERPVLLSPLHRQHSSDSTPTFGWTGISNANLYRLMLFDDSVVANRTVDIRQNTSGAETNLTLSQPLSVGRYFWRIRGRQNRVWSLWSTRFTLFIDPPTFSMSTPVPTVELAPPAELPSPTPISVPGPVTPPTLPAPPNSR